MTIFDLQEEARNERNNYMRAWRKKNPDKVREANRKYWEKKAIERKEENKDAEATDTAK